MSEIVIIGGGPAGLTCAYYLAKSGKDVTLIEKRSFPVNKLCAGGLTLKDLEELPKTIIERSFLTQIIHTPWGKTMFKTSKPVIFTLHRRVLSQWLFERAKKVGVKIIKGKVIKIDKNKVIIKDGKVYAYKYLVGADGSTSIVRRHLRIPNKHYFIAWQTSIPLSLEHIEWFLDARIFGFGYGWLFPLKDSTLIGFVCSHPQKIAWAKVGFLQWLKKTHGLAINPSFKAQFINTDYRGYHFGRIYLAGDAAGLASGLTGEGVYFALKSGKAIAQKILLNKKEGFREVLKIKNRHEKAAMVLKCLPQSLLNCFFACFRKGLKNTFFREIVFKWYG